jgi:hypothetical protein
MLQVTQRAKEHLLVVLRHRQCNDDVGLRLTSSGDITLDVAGANDIVFC